ERDTLSKLLGPRLDRTFMTELRVPQSSPVIGKSISEANLNGGSGLQVLQVNRGATLFSRPEHDVALQAGDLLVIHGQARDAVNLRGSGHQPLSRTAAVEASSSDDGALVDAIVGRDSRFSHRPRPDLGLSAGYGINALAVHRLDESIQSNCDDLERQFR